ncbi:FtsB family cell division protein [Tepidibacillus fermentans]|uniref:Cell division protein FtsB n=1 Tax=Tepidibacillus fermentans TaxID=1281767 RepID=A0A4R3KB14_9BACI|nr:septum formation initiator family protein [Tepidibacillus fermentans]TCS80153.1 cell division protein FtsB [Tepidibacillus fermentans]
MAKTNQGTKNSKKRLQWVLFILFLFLVWAGYTGYNQWTVIQQKKDKIEKLKVQEQNVQKEKQELEKQILLLQKDDYIAEIARKYYFLSKPGEFIFISPQ